MEFLYLLEELRTPIVDKCMLLITQMGEETVFLLLALIIFWCVDKYKGYYIMGVGFVGTILNQFLKLWLRIPRPWIIDPQFTILEEARDAALGYSFPSGHTQSAVGTFGSLAYTTKQKWLRIVAIIVAVLVPFSRMYIGVHTPLDVFVSIAIAMLLIVIMKPIVLSKDHRPLSFLICFMVFLCGAFTAFVNLYPFPADIDAHNLESGLKNACTLSGALAGLLIVYVADEKWLHFPTEAPLWAQFIKVSVGLCLVLVVKVGLEMPLDMLLGKALGRSARYCFVVIVAGILWPLSFRLFQYLGSRDKKGKGNNNEM